MYRDSRGLPSKSIFKLVMLGIVLLCSIILIPNIVEHLDATHVMVVQYPSGTLVWYTTPGWKTQWFGKVTKYHKRSNYWFSASKDQGDKGDQSIKVRFNDGGHAQVSGSIAWEIPIDEKTLTLLHTKYGDQLSVEQDLVRTVIEKAVYMTGPLMSSKESYAERRNDLIRFIEDQIQNGIYQTQSEQVKEPDPMTGQLKTVYIVKLVEKNGVTQRQEESPLTTFGIRTFNLSLNSITYDETVEKQIAAQQQATMQVQTAIAKAKEAEQQAITAAKNGEAEAATAKWKQEVIKAQAVTEAEQKLAVAELDRKAAEQEKQRQILLGEGEAARRKLVMAADNALDARLDAWVKVNQRYAQALENVKQPLVPYVVSGGGGAQSGIQQLIDLLTVKTAKEIGVQTTPGQSN